MNRYLLDANHLSACLDRQPVLVQRVALNILRLWPDDAQTAAEFAALFQELRSAGRMLSQFDLLIAALARQRNLTRLTADHYFQPVNHLRVENWL